MSPSERVRAAASGRSEAPDHGLGGRGSCRRPRAALSPGVGSIRRGAGGRRRGSGVTSRARRGWSDGRSPDGLCGRAAGGSRDVLVPKVSPDEPLRRDERPENAPGENAGPSHVSHGRALFSNSGGIRLLLSGVSLRDPGPGGLTVALRARPRLPAEGTLWKIHMRGTRAFDGRVSCGDVSPRARPAEGRCCERAQLGAASFAVTTGRLAGRARCRVNSGLLLLHP